MNEQAVKSRVHRYFSDTTQDYLKYYGTGRHHHMHYGFDRDLPKGASPTSHLVRYMASLAGLLPRPSISENKNSVAPLRVLDAGCGVGGASILLAREAGCDCVGITLVEEHAKLARQFALRDETKRLSVDSSSKDLSGSARFVANDYTIPAFKPESFDVILALESFCYAPDKEAWIRGMAPLLKPGGRLVIADGFSGSRSKTQSQERSFQRFLKGWAVPHFCTSEQVIAWAEHAGLETVHAEDITKDVLPHAWKIFRLGPLIVPWRWILHKLGISGEEKLNNAYAIYHQYPTLKKGLWRYSALCFRKPL